MPSLRPLHTTRATVFALLAASCTRPTFLPPSPPPPPDRPTTRTEKAKSRETAILAVHPMLLLVKQDGVYSVSSDWKESKFIDRPGFRAGWNSPAGLLLYDSSSSIIALYKDGALAHEYALPTLSCDGQDLALILRSHSDLQHSQCEGCFTVALTPDEGSPRGEVLIGINTIQGSAFICETIALDSDCRVETASPSNTDEAQTCIATSPGAPPTPAASADESYKFTSPSGRWTVAATPLGDDNADPRRFQATMVNDATGDSFVLRETSLPIAAWPPAAPPRSAQTPSSPTSAHAIELTMPDTQIFWVDNSDALAVRTSLWEFPPKTTLFVPNRSVHTFDGFAVRRGGLTGVGSNKPTR